MSEIPWTGHKGFYSAAELKFNMAKSLEELTEWLDFTLRGGDQPLSNEERITPQKIYASTYLHWVYIKETVCLSNSQIFILLSPL